MGNLVRGRDVIVSLKISGTFYPVFCAKSATLTSNQDEIEVTHINSGADREYVPGMGNATLDVSGITTIDNSNSRVSLPYLLQAAQRRTTFEMRVLLTDEDANPLAITFSAFSTTRSLTKEMASYSQSSITFRITGGIAMSTVIPEPELPPCDIESPLYLTLLEGDTEVSDALLEQTGVEILGVARETDVYTETTGSPGNLQFRFTALTGTIDFQNPGNPGGENIWVLYKIV